MKHLLLFSLLCSPAFASPLASLEADLDGDRRADSVALKAQADSDYLRLEIRLATGKSFVSRKLVRALRKAQLAVTPLGLLVSTLEDQSSAAKAYDYLIVNLDSSRAELGEFAFHYDYPSGVSGACRVMPGSGMVVLNGKATEITPRRVNLSRVSGAWYENLCHRLATQ